MMPTLGEFGSAFFHFSIPIRMAMFYEVRSGNAIFRSPRFTYRRADRRTFTFSSSAKPPVEQGGGERVLNLLGDIFLRSQNLTDKEFIVKLERGGIAYAVRRLDTATVIEIGRYCYRFDEHGQSRGGWINNLAADRRSDWEKWAALLTEPLS
jgi:hypothetical protein